MIYYRELTLDRASELRKDRDWVLRQWTRRQCRVFVLHNEKSLLHLPPEGAGMPQAVQLPPSRVDEFVGEVDEAVFLGLDETGPLFALDLTHRAEQDLGSLADAAEFVDLRKVGWLLDAQQAARLAYARGLVFWNRHHRFCGSCGSPTQSCSGGHMRRCTDPDCGRMHFPRTDPAVIMLVEDRSDPDRPRCLLARNVRFPSRMMSTLAGYVDPLESLEETVVREVFEECGIRVGDIAYQASQPWPFPSSIMLGFRARALNTDIVIDNDEIAEAHWFEAEQLQEFGEWGDEGSGFCLPRRDSIARFLVNSWMEENLRR